MNTFPIIETERLVLRKLKEADWEIVSYLRSDEIVNQFVKRKNADTQEKALDFILNTNLKISNNELIYWCITLKNETNMIGSICLWNFSEDRKVAEIGYDLNPKYQRKGIMNESMIPVLNFGFGKLNLDKIEAFTQKQNKNSISLLINNQFHLNKERFDKDNEDNRIFELYRPAANNG
ncbi:GNAT family N-acetyltransferase [Christiangramia sp. LLG6405-1]|uniref:GNAT family N-acetyltransferase n=1 Tax=Christiangramia sp. LLG6405-1 TaxID=3160832 RepID=UPI0038701B9E